MRTALLIVYFFLCAALSYLPQSEATSPPVGNPYPIKSVLRVSIDSSINPGTYSYLKSAYEKALQDNHQAILITLNTPGGLVSTTKDLLTLMGDASIPTLFWVTPEGASATSAGAIWASGSHLLYMSKGTNIGAATPIEMSGQIEEGDGRKKAINDLVALVKGLSLARHRNPTAFGQMIEEARSYDDQEALKQKVINGVVSSSSELFEKINGQLVEVKGVRLLLLADAPVVVDHSMGLGQKLLDFLSDPALAYILFLLGAALIYVELQAPGGFLAGSIGVLCLLLAGIAFQVLPLNYGALGLLALSFVLFVLEVFITSYGLLSLAGIVSMALGSLFLYHTEDSYLSLSMQLIMGSVGSVVLFLIFVLFFLVRDLGKKKTAEFNPILGQKGSIAGMLENKEKRELYHVNVHGELWKAISSDGQSLRPGDAVVVSAVDRDGMTLTVTRAQE